MAYSLHAFNQAASRAHGQGRQLSEQEFTEIGGSAQDFPLIYGQTQQQPGATAQTNAQQQQPLQFGQPASGGNSPYPMAYGQQPQYSSAQIPQFVATGAQRTVSAPQYGATAIGQQQASGATAQPRTATGQSQGFSISGMPNPQTNASNAISAQFGLNNINIGQQQQLNRVNEINPYGSATYVRNPDGSITRQYALSPEQQMLLNQQQGRDIALGGMSNNMLGQVGQQYRQPIDLARFGDVSNLNYANLPQLLGAQDMIGERQRTEDAVYNSFARRNDPEFKREEESLYQSLADRGIDRSSNRAKIEIENMRQRQEDARLNAADAARVSGLSELQGLFGLSSNARTQLAGEQRDLYSADNAARDKRISEMLMLRDRPASEIATLLGLQRGITNPEFAPISNINVPTIDAIGAGLGFRQDETSRYLGQLQAQTARANAAAANALGYAQLSANNDYRQQELDLRAQELDLTYGNQSGWGDVLLGAGIAAGGSALGEWGGNALSSWWNS